MAVISRLRELLIGKEQKFTENSEFSKSVNFLVQLRFISDLYSAASQQCSDPETFVDYLTVLVCVEELDEHFPVNVNKYFVALVVHLF